MSSLVPTTHPWHFVGRHFRRTWRSPSSRGSYGGTILSLRWIVSPEVAACLGRHNRPRWIARGCEHAIHKAVTPLHADLGSADRSLPRRASFRGSMFLARRQCSWPSGCRQLRRPYAGGCAGSLVPSKMRPFHEIGKHARHSAPPVIPGAPAKDVDSHCEHDSVQQWCVAALCSSAPARPVSSAISG